MAATRTRVRVVAADPSAHDVVSRRRLPRAGRDRPRAASATDWRRSGASAADVLVSIPMLGVADSLNVGHAAALLLYEALHQHRS